MRIAVAYKWAPNPHDAQVATDGSVDWSRARAAIGEYDQVAIEFARQLADAAGAELVGISVGGPDVASAPAKKAALARGLDRLVLIADAALNHAGPVDLGLTLADAVRSVGDVDLLIAGDASIDVGTQTVPAVAAGALGVPFVAQTTSVTGGPGDLTIERALPGGTQTLHATGPLVIAVTGDAVTPRVPGMRDILAAGKKPTQQLPFTRRPTVAASVTASARPELKARRGEIIDASAPDAVARLVAALQAAGHL